MGIAHDAVKAVGHALHDVHAGKEKLAARHVAAGLPPTLMVTSAAFSAGARIPTASSADGEGVPRALAWTGVPPSARSVVVVVEDPDAPFPEPFVHWLLYGIPATTTGVTAKTWSHFEQGKNSMLKSAFAPVAPPPGHGTHDYHFQVFALDCDLMLPADAGRGAVVDAMKGHVLAWGELVGTYERA